MSDITYQTYWQEVLSLAESTLQEVTDEHPDASEDELREDLQERLWETVDGHQWVIYTANHYPVLHYSNNDAYAIEEWGTDGLIEDGQLRTDRLAFGALYADVSEKLWELFEKREDEEDEEDDPEPTVQQLCDPAWHPRTA